VFASREVTVERSDAHTGIGGDGGHRYARTLAVHGCDGGSDKGLVVVRGVAALLASTPCRRLGHAFIERCRQSDQHSYNEADEIVRISLSCGVGMRVLTIGATGQYAGLAVPALVAKGLQVRALVHDPGKVDRLESAGVYETVVGDLRDPERMRAALDGVDGLFLIIPAFAPDTAELGTALVAAAQDAGVRRVVFSGVYHPSLSLVNHASTRPIEESLYRSGLEFTVLQPAMFMQGLAGGWTSAVEQGVFGMPYSKDSAMTFVDYRDVAEVAVTAFASDDLVNGTFELAAGGMVTRTELAVIISRHAGRQVVAVDVPPTAALDGVPAGSMRDGLAAMFDDYTAHGFHGGNDLVLRSILGRAPRSLDAFFAQLAAESAPTPTE
jgi:uncharacterized protein YbjT (DUF2867 family)